MLVYIHTGALSRDNGAYSPGSWFFSFAAMLGLSASTGHYYGDDYLEIPAEDWPVAEQLLIEAKMLYCICERIGQLREWQNAQSPKVRKLLGLPEAVELGEVYRCHRPRC